MGKALQVRMTFLHRLQRYSFSLDEQHHDDIREQEEGLFQQRSHRLDRVHLLRATENLAGASYVEISELTMLIFRVSGQ